ncbi:MAG: transglycosylase SLT domain-containing protein [Clostridia bacterium]|nr:transglycosylase SLT domain-containing protein [Clostridia bacterium]
MRLTVWRAVAFLLLIALSVGFGFGFDAIATAVERHQYPLEEALVSSVQQASEEYGIPEPILWATLCTGSGFASNHVSEDGAIGLMQLTPARFDYICTALWSKEPMDTGMLYDPATNLSAGCAYLSYLYARYGVWEQVFAAYIAGTEDVDRWLSDPTYLSEQGVLQNIPDSKVAAYVENMTEAVAQYTKLYY